MAWFRIPKNEEELRREQERKHWLEEEEQRKREQIANAEATVYKYADELKFPTRDVDVIFYNHLFSILLEQQKRIDELEKQVFNKK